MSLEHTFKRHFGRAPTAIAEAPGRVNLIGEHTDYNGLPVLPMAINRTIRIAASPRPDSLVRLRNCDPAWPACEYSLERAAQADPAGHWANYHRAAVVWLTRDPGPWRGGDFLVSGDIPAAAGLSSSSALVVASALAYLAVNEREPEPERLAVELPRAERFVGTLSGGIDQATSLLAVAGHALRIDFFPLRTRPVRLPDDMAVVVCHSLVQAEKSGATREAFNRRVQECAEGRRLLQQALGIELEHLGELRQRPPAELLAGQPRLRHVLSEAERVEAAVSRLEAGDLEGFGQLMDLSHKSCRDDYEVSCPELEELVACARRAGALGARLTGAGFGGCTVNLLRRSEVACFLDGMDRSFYVPRLDAGSEPGPWRFPLEARAGARVVLEP